MYPAIRPHRAVHEDNIRGFESPTSTIVIVDYIVDYTVYALRLGG